MEINQTRINQRLDTQIFFFFYTKWSRANQILKSRLTNNDDNDNDNKNENNGDDKKIIIEQKCFFS